MNVVNDILLFARLLIYPSVAYVLVAIAYSGRDGGKSKMYSIHMMTATVFMLLWAAALLRLLKTGEMIVYSFLDYFLTPTLFLLAILAWRALIRYAKKDVRDIELELRSKTNG